MQSMKNKNNEQLKKTYFTAMKEQLLSLGKARGIGRVLEGSAFWRITVVTSFKLGASTPNKLLEGLGININLVRKKEVLINFSDEKVNKYMKYTIRRIIKLVVVPSVKEWK